MYFEEATKFDEIYIFYYYEFRHISVAFSKCMNFKKSPEVFLAKSFWYKDQTVLLWNTYDKQVKDACSLLNYFINPFLKWYHILDFF